jgi:hypothetical protein
MDVANTFKSLLPIFKESYASKPMKTHKKPGKEEKFKNLKIKLKK